MKDVNKTALYRYFNSDDALLYVGISSRLTDRVKRHSIGSDFFSQSVRMTIEWFDTRDEAIDAEIIAIKSENPLFNVVHNNTIKEKVIDEDVCYDPESRPGYMITAVELSYIVAVYREMKFSEAAKTLNVAQSSISVSLKKLQEKIGLKLYSKNDGYFRKTDGERRDNRTVVFTEKGHQVLEECEKLEKAFLEFERNVNNIKRKDTRRYLA